VVVVNSSTLGVVKVGALFIGRGQRPFRFEFAKKKGMAEQVRAGRAIGMEVEGNTPSQPCYARANCLEN